MTPQAFIAHWQHNNITERAGAQQHFNDLCEVLGVEKPRDAENYTFERGAKMRGGQGWADVWKRGCFAWEYKAPGRDLNAALKQLMNYALALDNPPLLVVSDLRNIEIHTHFTGHPSEIHRFDIHQLTQPETLQKLKWLFNEPERFKPQRTTYAVTELAAKRIGEIAERLNARANAAEEVAHFLIQCVFCMFAEDAKLLPEKLFETVLDKSNPDGSKAQKRLSELFNAMQGGGDFAMNDIPWFNGGLFKIVNVPVLQTNDVVSLLEAARMDWSQIEPAILGTLFERGLNPDMRSQLGAHYTDPATIMKIIRPVIEQPLLAEWAMVKAKIAALAPKMALIGSAKSNHPNKEMAQGYQHFRDFLSRLKNFKVLDPACGSGNFLYLALKTLKDIEHRVNLEVETFGLHRELSIETSPANVLGIELNPYAAELARVTVWIGEIQWMLAHGYQYRKDPILAPLDHIENRDAILNEQNEAQWPAVDAIVGNPPFLGQRFMLKELGGTYTSALRSCFKSRVDGNADLVMYWLEKARMQITNGQARYAGFVSTNSVRGGSNQKTLAKIIETSQIFEAWGDEEWVNAGAAVRVSLVCFGENSSEIKLNNQPVSHINADLTSGNEANLTSAKQLTENKGVALSGFQMNGAFDIPFELAQAWLSQPNPNGKPNIDVLHPYCNAKDITSRDRNQWVIEFTGLTETEAALYEKPFEQVLTLVKPERSLKSEAYLREKYWLHKRSSPEMRAAIRGLGRFIATPMVSKYRLFVWLPEIKVPENAAIVIARNDDTTFGILHSRFHELWSLRMGTSLEDRPRYTPTTCFETFPFPEGLTPKNIARCHAELVSASSDEIAEQARNDSSQAYNFSFIATAAIHLNQLRENWLNPTKWVDWVITPEEEKAGFPKRAIAKAGFEAELKKRTLTNLYNQRPTWLDNAHKALDAAVATAYGWQDYKPEMPDDEILRRLLKLNLERSQTQG
ncbi:MAG: DNA methyltransferase [Methylotenera sp.]